MPLSSKLKKTPFSSSSQGEKSPRVSRNHLKQATKITPRNHAIKHIERKLNQSPNHSVSFSFQENPIIKTPSHIPRLLFQLQRQKTNCLLKIWPPATSISLSPKHHQICRKRNLPTKNQSPSAFPKMQFQEINDQTPPPLIINLCLFTRTQQP
jgi:hypothetical protein